MNVDIEIVSEDRAVGWRESMKRLLTERDELLAAESTNTRVKWWSVAQIVLLFVVCFWQVRYLKHFFEVKRGV